MDLAYRYEADFTEVVPVGFVPEGIRLDVYYSGQVVEGPLSGATLRGIDYLLLRSDGVGVIDAHNVISTDSGQHVWERTQGYIDAPPPEVQMPPPEAMLHPDTQWPDFALPMHGFALYRTGAEELGWMNSTALAFKGTVNVGTGKLIVVF